MVALNEAFVLIADEEVQVGNRGSIGQPNLPIDKAEITAFIQYLNVSDVIKLVAGVILSQVVNIQPPVSVQGEHLCVESDLVDSGTQYHNRLLRLQPVLEQVEGLHAVLPHRIWQVVVV